MKRIAFVLGLLLTLLTIGGPERAVASGGAGGGSGGSGGNKGMITSTLPFDNWGVYYNLVHPLGTATFTYSADGADKCLNVQLSNINAPDGTVLTVEIMEVWSTPTGSAWAGGYYPVTINQKRGSLSLSTANGVESPFLTPAQGQTNIYVVTQANAALMGLQLGHNAE